MGPENAQIMAQLTMLAKLVKGMGGDSVVATPLRGYVARYDHSEPYFQEDGKGYLQIGSELTDPTLYDTKAFPYEEVMPSPADPFWINGQFFPTTAYGQGFVNWRWSASDDTNIAFGIGTSLTFSKDGVNFQTRYLDEIPSTGWSASNDIIANIYDAMYIDGFLHVLGNTKSNTQPRLLKFDANCNKFSEFVANTSGAARFKKTNGRLLIIATSTVFLDITNIQDIQRYTVPAFSDVTYWGSKWWYATSSGLKSSPDPAGTMTTVTSGAHYVVSGNGANIIASNGSTLVESTDGTNWNPVNGPESLALGSVGGGLSNESNGKLFIKGGTQVTTITANQALLVYDFTAKTWKEVFPAAGALVISSQAWPVWYRGEWWVFGVVGNQNGYSRSPDLQTWSGDGVDARPAASFVRASARNNVIASVRDGQKILHVFARYHAYSTDGGVTFTTALNPQKTAGFLTPYGTRVIADGREFFIFSYRGSYVTSDFVTWTALPAEAALENSAGLESRVLTRLSTGVWILHGNVTTTTYYSTDRGRSWLTCSVSNVIGAYYDSKRSKYVLLRSGVSGAWVGDSLASMSQVNINSLGLSSGQYNCYFDATNDQVFLAQHSGVLRGFAGDRPHTVNGTYSLVDAAQSTQTLQANWGAGPTGFEVINGVPVAISNQVIRHNDVPSLRGIRCLPGRTYEEVMYPLPVGGWELPFVNGGGVYPQTQVPGATFAQSRMSDCPIATGKRKFAIATSWFELDLSTGAIVRLNDPKASFKVVGRVGQINPTFRSKVANDGKGTSAYVCDGVLYVSKNGGEFLPELTGAFQNVQYAGGYWSLITVHWDARCSSSATAVETVLNVCISKDLVTWKSKSFAMGTNANQYVDFVWAFGKWWLLYVNSLAGASSSTGAKFNTWIGSGGAAVVSGGYIIKDDELVIEYGGSLIQGVAGWNLYLSTIYGAVVGVEYNSTSSGDYVNCYSGNDSQTTAWTQQLSRITYTVTTATTSGNPDGVSITYVKAAHTLLDNSKTSGQFTYDGAAVIPRATSIQQILGDNIPRYTLTGNAAGTGWIDWGKHRYMFPRSGGSIIAMLSGRAYRTYPVWDPTNVHVSITTTDDGQLFIMTSRGALIRGKRGIIAPAPKSTNNANYYMRVL